MEIDGGWNMESSGEKRKRGQSAAKRKTRQLAGKRVLRDLSAAKTQPLEDLSTLNGGISVDEYGGVNVEGVRHPTQY
ncbi:MAG TPA: hypothetical protein V6D17_04940 [Candidatus Obscuribacterales bacterium]